MSWIGAWSLMASSFAFRLAYSLEWVSSQLVI